MLVKLRRRSDLSRISAEWAFNYRVRILLAISPQVGGVCVEETDGEAAEGEQRTILSTARNDYRALALISC